MHDAIGGEERVPHQSTVIDFETELASQHFIQQARGRRPPASGYRKLECAHDRNHPTLEMRRSEIGNAALLTHNELTDD